jgi:hypothetical protein
MTGEHPNMSTDLERMQKILHELRGRPDGAIEHEAADELERLMNLIDYHNHTCQKACGFGELEAVACGYRPYFENNRRRCTNCPTDWKIER